MPKNEAEAELGERYLRSWDAVGHMLENGKSWSGRERNCAFLNTGGPRFADVSSALGLDDMYDSRGLAITDWDGDGDLDLWMAHRTAPRVSLYRNNSQENGRSLRLRLEGTKSNRDAIGARVELILAGESKQRRLRTLRAGEGFLSQSSKTIHFGLPPGAMVDRIEVNWPSGGQEIFRGLRAGQIFQIKEGAGQAQAIRSRESVNLAESPPKLPDLGSGIRIVPHARLPIPAMPYLTMDGKTERLAFGSGARVIVLWATWCQPCLQELNQLKACAAELRKAGLEVLCLSIDDPAKPLAERVALIRSVTAKLGLPFSVGLATQDLLDQLDAVQRVLVSREQKLALPCSFVLDSQRRLAALYRGAAPLAGLLADASRFAVPEAEFRAHAVPFSGIWLMQSMPTDLLAIPEKLTEWDRPADALEYLDRVLVRGKLPNTPAELPSPSLNFENLGEAYHEIAKKLALANQDRLSLAALSRAAHFLPGSIDIRAGLAMQLERAGQIPEAIAQYRGILGISPEHPAAANSLAWLLATTNDPSQRKPEEAISMAEAVVRRTQSKMAEPLDTLAAAYAAAGRFPQAVQVAGLARKIAGEAGQKEMLSLIEERLRAYQAGRAFTQPKR